MKQLLQPNWEDAITKRYMDPNYKPQLQDDVLDVQERPVRSLIISFIK